MQPGTPSMTAQRVAAYRLAFERIDVPYGDPAVDERLSRDVAGSVDVDLDADMARYLKARTAFFDRVVVNAINRNVTQVVVLGAGYDGRSLRFARSGVHWFEVDHPDTQRDKLTRLERLGIAVPDVTFVSLDFQDRALADALVDAGFVVDSPAQFICEGVAVYLVPAVLESLLADARELATVGTRLAISLSVSRAGKDLAERREAFQAAVGALGEEARTTLTAGAATTLLESTRWHPAALSERAQRAGFVVAEPVWTPEAAVTGRSVVAPVTRSRIGRFMERTFHRSDLESLPGHLETTYGIAVAAVAELDVGVLRIDRSDGPAWLARIFPAARPLELAEHDAAVLHLLEDRAFPAERCAAQASVSLFEGQGVLITEYVRGAPPPPGPKTFRMLGDLLGQLHSVALTAREIAWDGGAWHHVSLDGGPSQEISNALSLLSDAEGRVAPAERAHYEALREELRRADGGDALPVALLHPDFALPNILTSRDGGTTIVDWTGAGRGPRIASLGFLLWVAGWRDPKQAGAVIAGYRRHIELAPEELARLAAVIRTRPLIFEAWAFCTGRRRLGDIAEGLPEIVAQAETIAARARDAWR
jgi:methyltransferase (TIGR00027 family)